MKSDLVQYSHRKDGIIDCKPKCQTLGTEYGFYKQFLQNILGFMNWYACE